jgi:hypothetical protein
MIHRVLAVALHGFLQNPSMMPPRVENSTQQRRAYANPPSMRMEIAFLCRMWFIAGASPPGLQGECRRVRRAYRDP